MVKGGERGFSVRVSEMCKREREENSKNYCV
jgi:hypothetical protein